MNLRIFFIGCALIITSCVHYKLVDGNVRPKGKEKSPYNSNCKLDSQLVGGKYIYITRPVPGYSIDTSVCVLVFYPDGRYALQTGLPPMDSVRMRSVNWENAYFRGFWCSDGSWIKMAAFETSDGGMYVTELLYKEGASYYFIGPRKRKNPVLNNENKLFYLGKIE